MGYMNQPGQPSSHSAPWLLARWILLTVVMAGIFAMHVLSQPELAGGHGMLMQPDPPASVSMSMSMTAQHHSVETVVAPGSPRPAAFMASSTDMSGSMLCCILLLVTGGLLILLIVLAKVRRDVVASVRPAVPLWARWRRGPPGGGPPRVSLCVLRV